jgi:pimeloyl-ACP methyl ester carboxylesterase
MDMLTADGVEIAYEVAGKGPAVLLIHGFASSARINWIDTGWVRTLADAGYTAITFDNRGHGASTKLYDPASYRTASMAGDALRLIDHLELSRVVAMGYSMGARIAARLAIDHVRPLGGLVLSGLAANLVGGLPGAEKIAQGLETESPESIGDPEARKFRAFAEQSKGDRRALAACMRGGRDMIALEDLGRIDVPTLVVAGENDPTAGPVAPLVAAIPGARGVTLPGRNHMNAVGDKGHKAAVLEFLASLPAPSG